VMGSTTISINHRARAGDCALASAIIHYPSKVI
jgi:hypothetical protein